MSALEFELELGLGLGEPSISFFSSNFSPASALLLRLAGSV